MSPAGDMLATTASSVAVMVVILAGITATAAARDAAGLPQRLADAFINFAYQNEFYAASVAVSYRGRALYAGARGHIGDATAHPGTTVPVLGLSKLVTAVAVLRLIEQGQLGLDTRVFGRDGVLNHLAAVGDRRLADVTVRHLLQHRAGWDEQRAPLYDPMLNEVYVRRGYNVTDIADQPRSMATDGQLSSTDIIRYVLTQPLHHDPGARVVHSNFGYCVLGRVIEAVSAQTYAAHVHDSVLVPAGMWRTRIGPPPHNEHEHAGMRRGTTASVAHDNDVAGRDKRRTSADESRPLNNLLRAELVDSTLALHSSVYDICRLFSSLTPAGPAAPALLSPRSLLTLLARPPGHHAAGPWLAMGIKVASDGRLSYESHDPIFDVNVYVYHRPLASGARDSLPTAFADGATVAFVGYTRTRRAHFAGKYARRMLHEADAAGVVPDAYLDDLAESRVAVADSDLLVRYRLAAHRLPAYASAARRAGYAPRWLHGYSDAGRSRYMTVFARAASPAALRFDLLATPSRRRAVAFVAARVSHHHQLTFLQSFVSASHNDRVCHVVVVVADNDDDDDDDDDAQKTSVQFNIGASVSEYGASLREALATGFTPVVQSVTSVDQRRHVTYLLQRPVDAAASPPPPPCKAYDRLTLPALLSIVRQSAAAGYTLEYLDSYRPAGHHTRFSAVFTRRPGTPAWVLQVGMSPDDMPAETTVWQGRGHVPRMLVAYTTPDDVTQVAIVWTKVGDE